MILPKGLSYNFYALIMDKLRAKFEKFGEKVITLSQKGHSELFRPNITCGIHCAMLSLPFH
jgi:hypothetical protein